MKIVDAHVHVGPEPLFGYDFDLYDYDRIMTSCGITKAIFTGSTEKRNFKWPERFKPMHMYYWVNLDALPSDIKSVACKKDGYVGIKMHPSIDNKPCTDPLVRQFVEKIAYKKIPILIHCGNYAPSHYSHALRLAEEFHDVNFILGHMGHTLATESVRMFERDARVHLPNVYFDMSSVKSLYQLEKAVKTVGPEKIIFASDYPWMHPKLSIELVNLLHISDDNKAMIFHKNIERLIK